MLIKGQDDSVEGELEGDSEIQDCQCMFQCNIIIIVMWGIEALSDPVSVVLPPADSH